MKDKSENLGWSGLHPALLAGAHLALALIAQPLAVGQADDADVPDDQDIYVLSPFTIDASNDVGYRKAMAITATRLSAPIIETPLNISVVSRELLDDLKVDVSNGAFNYVSGVNTNYNTFSNILTPTRASSGVFVRGFSLDNFVYQDGYRRFTAFAMDGVERVEVLKGPVSLLFGRMDPGGLINFVTRKPAFVERSHIDVTVGNDNYFKSLLDTQGIVVDDKLAYRFTGSLKDADSWYQNAGSNEHYFLGSLSWNASERLRLLLQFEDFNQENFGGPGGAAVMQSEYMKTAGAAPFSGPNQLPFSEIDADNDPSTPPIRLYESAVDFARRVSAEREFDMRNFDSFWFPREFNFNRNGPGAQESNFSKTWLADAVFSVSENLDLRAAVNLAETEASTFWFINADPHQSPGRNLNSLRGLGSAFANDGDPNCFTCFNYGFFMSPRFDPGGSGRPGRVSNINEYSTVQLDATYRFEALGADNTLSLSAEFIDNEFRQFGFITDRDAFVAAGGIPAGAQGFGSDPGLSAASNQILVQRRQQLEDWGLIPAGSRIPNDNFSALFVDIMNPSQQIPNLADMISGRADFTSAGSNSQDQSLGLTYQGEFLEGRLRVLGGARWNEFETISAEITPDQIEREFGQTQTWDEVTPSIGFLFELTDSLNAYAGYSENFLPRPGNINEVVINQQTGERIGGELLGPELGQGWELGLKSETPDRKLAATVSYFALERQEIVVQNAALQNQIVEENEAALAAGEDPIWVDEAGTPFLQNSRPSLARNGGAQRVTGIEAEITYSPIPNFQALVGFSSYFDKEWKEKDPAVVNVQRGGLFTGRFFNDGRDAIPDEINGVPDHMVFAWGKYRFIAGPLENLEFGFGGNWQDEQITEVRANGTFNPYTNDAFWRLDSMVAYTLDWLENPLRLQLTVNNLLDEEIVAGSFGLNPTREWRLSASYSF